MVVSQLMQALGTKHGSFGRVASVLNYRAGWGFLNTESDMGNKGSSVDLKMTGETFFDECSSKECGSSPSPPPYGTNCSKTITLNSRTEALSPGILFTRTVIQA